MENLRPGTPEELYAQAQRGAVWCAVCEEADSAEAAADKLTHGYCVVVFPRLAKALCFEAKSGTRRGPSAPESENTVKGAKDAFTETIRINTALGPAGICARRSCGLRARPSGGGRRRM